MALTASNASDKLLSNLDIPPIVESLFHAIYKKLCNCDSGDSNNSSNSSSSHVTDNHYGLVNVEDLYMVLVYTSSIKTLIILNIGYERYNSCIEQLKKIAQNHDIVLYSERFENVENNCVNNAALENIPMKKSDINHTMYSVGKLSYGEMLLLLIPDNTGGGTTEGGNGVETVVSRSDRRQQECLDLQRKGFYQDNDFSMIPLQLNSNVIRDENNENGDNFGVYSGACANCNSNVVKEMKRLRKERSVLLERVQYQCRHLDRRVEGVRECYDGLLREVSCQALLDLLSLLLLNSICVFVTLMHRTTILFVAERYKTQLFANRRG